MSELDLSVLARERGWLHKLASTLVQDDEEARDLVQQTVLRALETPAQGGVPTLAWLDRILRNLWIDTVRRRRAHVLEDPTAVSSTKPSVEEAAQRWEASSALRDAVAKLPREQWEVVVLRFQEELTNAEIADRLGISPRTVVTRLSHAYAGLRSQLSGRFGRENWALALVPMAALVGRQKSRMASVSAAAVLVGVTVIATVLGVGVLRATDLSTATLEAAGLPVADELVGAGVKPVDADLAAPPILPRERAGTLSVNDPASNSKTTLEPAEEAADLGPQRHVVIDGEPVLGYEAGIRTDAMKLPEIDRHEVKAVGEDGFALASVPGFKIMLRKFADDDTRWISYPSEIDPNLTFTTGSLEVHLGSQLDLPEGAPVREDGSLEWFFVYWTDGVGVEWLSTATFEDGVATVERVPEGQIEFKLFVSGSDQSAKIGSWPRLGTARITSGERTVVSL